MLNLHNGRWRATVLFVWGRHKRFSRVPAPPGPPQSMAASAALPPTTNSPQSDCTSSRRGTRHNRDSQVHRAADERPCASAPKTPAMHDNHVAKARWPARFCRLGAMRPNSGEVELHVRVLPRASAIQEPLSPYVRQLSSLWPFHRTSDRNFQQGSRAALTP